MTRPAGLSCHVIESLEELQEYRESWSQLAEACGKPTSRPQWLEAWWTAGCAPADRDSRALRVAAVTAGERLVGLLPGYLPDQHAAFPELRLLGQPRFWGVGPLVSEDAPPETVALIARALGERSPAPARIPLDCVPRNALWLEELRRGWPGGSLWLRRGRPSECLVVEGPMSSDEWLQNRSKRLRDDLHRLRRRRSEAGFELRMSESPEEVRADLAALARLHHARLNFQSQWLVKGVEDVLVRAGGELISRGDFRLWKIVREGEMVAGALSARAGNAAELLLTAFDPAWSRFGVGVAAVVAAIEDQLDAGTTLIDFGPGGFRYLRLLSNSTRPMSNYELFPSNRRTVRARAHWFPAHARERANILRVELKLGRRVRALRR